MAILDSEGLCLTGATAEARDHYERSLGLFRCYIGDPVAAVDAGFALCPGFAMSHVRRACLLLMSTERGGFAMARDSLAAGAPFADTPRERGHAVAIGHLVAGRWHEAARVLQRVSIDHPRDLLALQVGH